MFLFVLSLGSSLSELSLLLSSELEINGAAYVTLHAGLPFLSFGISQLSN